MTGNLVIVISIVLCQVFLFLYLSCPNKLIIIIVEVIIDINEVTYMFNEAIKYFNRIKHIIRETYENMGTN